MPNACPLSSRSLLCAKLPHAINTSTQKHSASVRECGSVPGCMRAKAHVCGATGEHGARWAESSSPRGGECGTNLMMRSRGWLWKERQSSNTVSFVSALCDKLQQQKANTHHAVRTVFTASTCSKFPSSPSFPPPSLSLSQAKEISGHLYTPHNTSSQILSPFLSFSLGATRTRFD